MTKENIPAWLEHAKFRSSIPQFKGWRVAGSGATVQIFPSSLIKRIVRNWNRW